MPIRLYAVWEPGELGIGKEFGPAGEVEPGLRLNIGELDGATAILEVINKFQAQPI